MHVIRRRTGTGTGQTWCIVSHVRNEYQVIRPHTRSLAEAQVQKKGMAVLKLACKIITDSSKLETLTFLPDINKKKAASK